MNGTKTARGWDKRAFTLIELLIVIGIIGILMAILMPAIGGAKKAALRQRAATEVTAIETAILAYLNDYGKFPLQPSNTSPDKTYSGNDYRDLIKILRADPAYPKIKEWNPRGTSYLKIQESSINKDDNDKLKDPWDRDYVVVADFNFDKKVQYTTGPKDRSVIVWSDGPNATITTDNLKSFEE